MAAGNYTTTSHQPYEGEMQTDEQLARMVETAPTDEDADHYTIMRMGELLAGIAVALKGPEEARKRHGYQDLPQLVQALVFEVAMLKQQVADYAAMYEPFKAMVDDAGVGEPLPEIVTVPVKILNADGMAEWADVCTEEQAAPAKSPLQSLIDTAPKSDDPQPRRSGSWNTIA